MCGISPRSTPRSMPRTAPSAVDDAGTLDRRASAALADAAGGATARRRQRARDGRGARRRARAHAAGARALSDAAAARRRAAHMREPAFWWRKAGLAAALLAPARGRLRRGRRRGAWREAGARAGVPVICVGNFTLGGAGKTPTAIIAGEDAARGGRAAVLSQPRLWRQRSPGRCWSMRTPIRAAQVGDEALLLARVAPTDRCARPRRRRARWRERAGASVIVMDDGLQNPSLAKDFTLAVVDGRRGIGNGRVFPAGPLARAARGAACARRCAAGGRRRRWRRAQ